MQNLEPVLIFITVAEMRSFTHAADSLGIQKGRASTAVRKLEEDVGVRLLHRTTRSAASADGVIRDVIIDVNGKPIHSMEELTSIFEDAGIGKQVTLTVERDGQTRSVKVTTADISQHTQG